MTYLFVIDDHPLYISGLQSAFSDGSDKIKITCSANSAEEALPLLAKSRAKVVLLDLKMEGTTGDEFCMVIKKRFPDKKVIILTGETDTSLLANAWNNDADAILIKHCGKSELIRAIDKVIAGERIVGSNVPEFINKRRQGKSNHPKLTQSELKVLSLLAKGRTRNEVGQILGNSQNTIDFHCKNLFKKFNKNKILSVIDEAKRLNLITQ